MTLDVSIDLWMYFSDLSVKLQVGEMQLKLIKLIHTKKQYSSDKLHMSPRFFFIILWFKIYILL